MNKHIHSFLIILLFTFISMPAAQAQIELNSTGQVGIGISPSSVHQLRVNNDLSGSTRYAIQGATTGSANTNFGVRGIASSGYTNYGIYGSASGGIDNWAGYFAGDVYSTGSYAGSDQRLKKNITALKATEMLSKVSQLAPKQYEFLSEEELRSQKLPALNAKKGDHFGLLAQEVERVFPELVIEVSHVLEDESDNDKEPPEIVTTKAINYQELTVVLLSALQELQQRVETLEAALNR